MNGNKPWIAEPTPSEWFIQHGAGSYEMNYANTGSIGADDPVPNNRFYVHNRTMPPNLDPLEFRLQVHGDAVAHPMNFTLSDLAAMPKSTARYVLDCGANGRSFFPRLPPPAQAQGWLPVGFTDWRWGAMGAAEWGGVMLDQILAETGVDTNNTYARLRGADEVLQGDGSTQPYSHVFDTSALAGKGIILAYEMNGAPLPRDHGAPLRAVIPGQGGNVSVKWLVELFASTQQIPWSPLQNNQMLWGPAYNPPVAPPPMLPKSAFELGWDGTITLDPNVTSTTLYGRAWSSNSTISGVAIRIEQLQDDRSWKCIVDWTAATLLTTPQANWWTRFSFVWNALTPGAYRLYSRATDILGNVQPAPDQFVWNQHGLHYNAHHGHPITVMPLQNMP